MPKAVSNTPRIGSESSRYYPIFQPPQKKPRTSKEKKEKPPRPVKISKISLRVSEVLKTISLDNNQSYWLERQRAGDYPFDLKPGEECSDDQATDLAECEMIPLIAFQVYNKLTNPFWEDYKEGKAEVNHEEVEVEVERLLLHS